MRAPNPFPGLVVGYSYLWHQDYKLERDFSENPATYGVILSVREELGDKIVLVAALTDLQPRNTEGVALPDATRERLGLPSAQYWIITSEVNRFIWPGPDLRSADSVSKNELNVLPPILFESIKSSIHTLSKRDQMKTLTGLT